MKKHIIILVASLCIFMGCSNGNGNGGDKKSKGDNNSSGDTDEQRTEVIGKIGKYESPYRVGDIVFNDGSAIPYSTELTLTAEQKSAAIAIIFYKGKGLNNGNDTATNRTLGVGLKHSRYVAWCEESVAAEDKGIPTIACEFSVKKGNYIFNDSTANHRNGSNNLELIGEFLSTIDGVTDDTTGDGAATRYPAFYFAKNYKNTATNLKGTSYETGWYLPSFAELYQIYYCSTNSQNAVDVDVVSELCNGDKFGDAWYWSSTPKIVSAAWDKYLASVFSFEDDSWKGCYKKNSLYCVCAIREFN